MFSDLAKGRQNNFQLVRALAAATVIVSHSFPIAGRPEPHVYGVTLGMVAVWTFFAVSGFLIFKSFERQPLGAFAESRILRIYPALIVVSLLTVFVIGPLFCSIPLRAYFLSRETIEYIPRALSLKFVSFELPGVFSSNPNHAVNGPLWTLWFEVSCYAGLVVGMTVLRRFAIFLGVYALAFTPLRFTLYGDLSLAFVTGMAIYRYRHSIPASFFAAVILLEISFFIPQIAPIAVAYAALWVCNLKGPQRAYNQLGDYSYGLYIYGWLAQEIVESSFPGLSPLRLMGLAFPLAVIAAVASWELIEHPSLAMKGHLLRTYAAARSISAARRAQNTW